VHDANILSVAGPVYDIVGALLLAEAIVRTRREVLMRQAHPGGQFASVNLALFAALEEQRHDARFGLGFLIFGFVLQLVAAFGVVLAHWLWIAVFLAVLAGVLLWWRLWSTRLALSRRMRVANSLEGIERANFLMYNPEERGS